MTRSVWLRVLWLSMTALVLPAQATVLDVGTGHRLQATPALQWCATPAQTGLADVLTPAGPCLLQVARQQDLARSFDDRAFWLRLTLANPSTHATERWLQVGHPRLEELSFFFENTPTQWQRTDVGINTPMAAREEVPAIYSVLALTLAPGQTRTVWVRVASRTSIDLSTTVWAPVEFRRATARTQLSVTLAMGGLLSTLMLALLLGFGTQTRTYAYFGVAMAGEIVLESFRGGLLQQHLWPSAWPMWPEVGAMGTTLALVGFSAFFTTQLPNMRHYPKSYWAWRVLVGVTLLGLGYALLLDYRAATQVWTVTLNAAIASGLLLAFWAWRDGARSAGTLLLSFVLLAALELLRLGTSLGIMTFTWLEALAGPWALVMTTPIILLSIFQHSRKLKNKLLQTQAESTARIDFLAKMSHELRTPLDTILGNAQLLEHANTPARRSEELGSIQQSGKHLLHIIDEILDHARGVAGKLPLEPAPQDLTLFLRGVAQNARRMAATRGNAFALQVQGDEAQWALLDAVRLRQVLDNLLVNAARHTQHGNITLRCVVQAVPALASWRLNFAVQDSGEGIAQADLERIFLPFERGTHNTRQGGKGTGMGLAIARQLVETMGGRLTVHSTPGQGACFEFTVEVVTCPAPHSVAPKTLTDNFTSPGLDRQQTILVVDDDDSSRRVLSSLFIRHGCMVLQAACGADVDTLLASQPSMDLVLTDQFMPNGDGWHVLRAVAACRSDVPVLLMSAAPAQRPSDFPEGLNFATQMLKPLDHVLLLQCLEEQLGINLQTHAIQSNRSDAAPGVSALTHAAVDSNELNALRDMIEQGRVSDVMRWALALKQRRPELAGLADELYDAASVLDFPKLRAHPFSTCAHTT